MYGERSLFFLVRSLVDRPLARHRVPLDVATVDENVKRGAVGQELPFSLEIEPGLAHVPSYPELLRDDGADLGRPET